MFSRDAITTAVACSCLLLMVASQSVNACSCYEAIEETDSCLADEILELTVETKVRKNERGDALGYYLYKIRIDKVIKSAMALEDRKEAMLKISDHESCTFNFATNTTYFIAADKGKRFISPVEMCVRDENGIKICKHIRVLVMMKKRDAE